MDIASMIKPFWFSFHVLAFYIEDAQKEGKLLQIRQDLWSLYWTRQRKIKPVYPMSNLWAWHLLTLSERCLVFAQLLSLLSCHFALWRMMMYITSAWHSVRHQRYVYSTIDVRGRPLNDLGQMKSRKRNSEPFSREKKLYGRIPTKKKKKHLKISSAPRSLMVIP